MRRFIALCAIVVLMLVAITPTVAGQNENHPAVGTWVIDTETANPDNAPTLITLGADGILTHVSRDGQHGAGSWTPTGAQTGDATFAIPVVDPEPGPLGFVTIRTSLEVSEDGQTFNGTYTIQFDSMVGAPVPTGVELGPADVTGVRFNVEPMGEPAGPWPPGSPPEE